MLVSVLLHFLQSSLSSDIMKRWGVQGSALDKLMLRILVACEFLSVYLISKVGYFDWFKAPASRDSTGAAEGGGGLQKNMLLDISQMHALASKSMHR